MKRLLLAAAACLLAAGPAAAAPAGVVVAVCDRDVAPYRELLESFTRECGCPVRVIDPGEVVREGLERGLQGEGVRAVLAIGVQAREAVGGLREVPVLLAMAPQAERWVAAQPNRIGIEMALPPRRNLETLRTVFPQAKRVGVVYDPAQAGDYVREALSAAPELGLTLEAREIARPAELQHAIDSLRARVDVFWVLPDPTVLQGENLNLLLLASFESRIPLFGFARKYAELGAVAAMQLDPAGLGAQAAALLHEPRVGAPAETRHVFARDARLVLNERVARKMGLTIGPAALEAAGDVIR